MHRYAFTEYTAPARWFVSMNYVVHSAMYSYYALKAMRYRVPQFVSIVITTAQLVQMVVGCAVNLWAYQVTTCQVILSFIYIYILGVIHVVQKMLPTIPHI